MNNKATDKESTYIQYLPANLQDDIFIDKFLQAFEKILSGREEIQPSHQEGEEQSSAHTSTEIAEEQIGLEQVINNIHKYFNPDKTPKEFLPWLAGWVAISYRDDWTDEVKRAFIRQMIGLYRWRGTKKGLTEILSLYLLNSGFDKNVVVNDALEQVPNYFQVEITLNVPNSGLYRREAKIAEAIINQEKPAQTYYGLKINVPTMRITDEQFTLTICQIKEGKIEGNTFLGTKPNDSSNYE